MSDEIQNRVNQGVSGVAGGEECLVFRAGGG